MIEALKPSNMTDHDLLDEYRELLDAELNDHVDSSISNAVWRNKRLGVLQDEIEKRGLKLPEVEEIPFEQQCERLRADLRDFKKSLKVMDDGSH